MVDREQKGGGDEKYMAQIQYLMECLALQVSKNEEKDLILKEKEVKIQELEKRLEDSE
jgi:hypothetical protein